MKSTIDTILLVDDDMSTNFLHKILLNKKRIAKNIVNLNNGMDTIDYLKNSSKEIPDAILLDLNMPVIDGWEFLDILEKENLVKNNDCKIIILTASQNPDHFEKSKKYSMVSGFLNKPLDIDELVSLL